MSASGLFPIAREVMPDQSVAQQTVTSLPFRACDADKAAIWTAVQKRQPAALRA